MPLRLTLATWDYDRTRPLQDGRVLVDDVDLTHLLLRPVEMFDRMLRERAFDASEMSLASLVTWIARGHCPFVGIPVFLSRAFRHDCVYVRADGAVRVPGDLRGRRVGVPQYGATAAVYVKGLLADDYGVRAEDVHWFTGPQDPPAGGGLDAGRRSLLPVDLPSRFSVTPIAEGADLSTMLLRGEIDALVAISLPSAFLGGDGSVVRLFADFKATELDWYARTRIFPVMHTVALTRAVHDAHPWVASHLNRAFTAAKAVALDGLHDTDALRVGLPWLIDHVEEARRVFGHDWWPYGVAANRPTLEALTRYVVEQGLAPRAPSLDEIFVAVD